MPVHVHYKGECQSGYNAFSILCCTENKTLKRSTEQGDKVQTCNLKCSDGDSNRLSIAMADADIDVLDTSLVGRFLRFAIKLEIELAYNLRRIIEESFSP